MIQPCEYCGVADLPGVISVHKGKIINWPDWDEFDERWFDFHFLHPAAQFQMPGVGGDDVLTPKNAPELGFWRS